MWQTLIVAVALCVSQTLTLTILDETCDANRRRVSINTANAKLLFGGLFDIRDPGSGGSGCGEPNLGKH